MGIEVTKELDFVRIGVDRYSLKTGVKVRSTMVLNTRVLKEPRGFVRMIQCILAILAFATTAGFDTSCKFSIECDKPKNDHTEIITYNFGYPFSINDNKITVPFDCDNGNGDDHDNGNNGNGHDNGDDDDDDDEHDQIVSLPFDFSTTAEFYVAIGVLSFLYTLIALVVYVFFHQQYVNDPKLPVVDLGLSAIISIFWLAGSSALARCVEDLKYYLHPDNMFGYMHICTKKDSDADCEVEEVGHYAELNVSLVFGFACFAIWLTSLWFIYKETVFHTPPETVADGTQNQSAKGDGRV